MRRQNPRIGRRIERSFSRFFELIDILGKFPRVSAGASLLSSGLFLRSVLMFHGAGTALMRNVDLHFIQRWTFAFSDVCFTQCGSCESYSSTWSPKLFCPSEKSLQIQTTQRPVKRNPHRTLHTIATALLSSHPSLASCRVVPQPSSVEMSTLRPMYIPFRTYKTDIRQDANSHQVIQCEYLSRSFCTAVGGTSQTGSCI